MTHIFWGYILIFFHLKINEFDLLPNFLGYVLIYIGLSKLLNESIHFKKATPYTIFMTITSTFITFGSLLGMSFNGEIFGIFSFITMLIFIYVKYLIVMGIKDIEQSYNDTLGFSSLFLIWKISFGLEIAIKVVLITRNEMLVLLGTLLTAIALCVNIVFLVYFYKAKKIYENLNDENFIRNDEIKKTKFHLSKNKIIVATILLTLISIFLLWQRGVFYIIDRQTSPSGDRTVTVYSRDVTETFPTDTGITFKHSGKSHGRTVYEDAEYVGAWWSPCSNYMVKSLIIDGEDFLILNSYNKNSSSNLSIYINMNLSPREKFSELMTKEEHWDTLEFEFVKWLSYEGDMAINFKFVDFESRYQSGSLNFNCETGVVSEVEFGLQMEE